tara:strand:- start:177 stop:962 length:786 start_codon:yes stop_codon:yes gene_type:complete
VVDFVDTTLNVTATAAGFAARPPVHVKTVGLDDRDDKTPPAGAWSVIVLAIAAVTAVRALTPGAVHDTVVESMKTVADAVNVMVSPLTSASLTPMEKTIDVGACPATTSFTEALVHVRRPFVVYPFCPVSGTVDVDDSALNVTVEAASPLTDIPPVHAIVTVAPATVEAAAVTTLFPPVSVSVLVEAVVTPPVLHVHAGAPPPETQISELAVSVTVCAVVRASVATITNVIPVGVAPAALALGPINVALVHPSELVVVYPV